MILGRSPERRSRRCNASAKRQATPRRRLARRAAAQDPVGVAFAGDSGAGAASMLRRRMVGFTNRRGHRYGVDRKGAMASVLTLWCTTRQCEVTTDLWLDAEALIDLAQQTDRLRCAVCGREHSIKNAYLKPLPLHGKRMGPSRAPPLPQRRADAH
jgi:hypothetical protein